MKTEIEIKSIFGELLFTYQAENATIKNAVEQAVKEKVSLRSADLRSADLRSADLRSADLYSADLYSANLRSVKNKEEASLPIYCKWSHSVIGDKIQIGCKTKTIEEWDSFFVSDEVYSTERNTDDFKQIQAVYESYKAYINFLSLC